MALIPQTIEEQIGALLDSTAQLELEESKTQFKNGLAQIIIAAIQSATVTIPPGAIITTGSAVTQTNPAPALGSLS